MTGPRRIEIESVNIGGATVLTTWSNGHDVVSGIDKRPVHAERIELSTIGLAGDVQADTRADRRRLVLG